MHCMNYWIGSEQESTLIFLLNSLAMKWCVCHGWASRLSSLFILIFVCTLHVRANSRPANCDSPMELRQRSTSANYSRFPRGMLETSEFLCPSGISECYIWSFRGVSCLANNFLLHFLWQLLQRILPAWRLVCNDGLDFCLPKFGFCVADK